LEKNNFIVFCNYRIYVIVNCCEAFSLRRTLKGLWKYHFECEENYYEFDENYYELDEKLL
jgi:hypothetical protein